MQNTISAEDVKYIRKQLKETQADFAQRFGVSRESIVKYENGAIIPESKQVMFRLLLEDVRRDDTSKNLVPFYDVGFEKDNLVLEQTVLLRPNYVMDIPEFSGCTAFRTYSDSMESKIKTGSILFGTRLTEWREHLEYGQIYGIVCNDGRKYLKYIRLDAANANDNFLLQSENPKYDDFSLPKNVIASVWLIHGWLHKQI